MPTLQHKVCWYTLLIILRTYFILLHESPPGPVPDSVPDFWRMVWEQGTATIVMLTNLEEKGRVCTSHVLNSVHHT